MGRQKKKTATTFEIRLTQNALQHLDEITGYIAFRGSTNKARL